MEYKDKEINHEESLAIIKAVIQNTQGHFQQSGFYYIFWGWILILANLAHFAILKYTDYPYPYIVWLISIPAWIITIVYSIRQGKNARVVTHLDRIMGAVWMSYGISIFILVIFGQSISGYFNPVILLMSAVPTMISGYTIRFKPLMFGAVIFWVLGAFSFFATYEWHFIISAASIFTGFLIPGYSLRKAKK